MPFQSGYSHCGIALILSPLRGERKADLLMVMFGQGDRLRIGSDGRNIRRTRWNLRDDAVFARTNIIDQEVTVLVRRR